MLYTLVVSAVDAGFVLGLRPDTFVFITVVIGVEFKAKDRTERLRRAQCFSFPCHDTIGDYDEALVFVGVVITKNTIDGLSKLRRRFVVTRDHDHNGGCLVIIPDLRRSSPNVDQRAQDLNESKENDETSDRILGDSNTATSFVIACIDLGVIEELIEAAFDEEEARYVRFSYSCSINVKHVVVISFTYNLTAS